MTTEATETTEAALVISVKCEHCGADRERKPLIDRDTGRPVTDPSGKPMMAPLFFVELKSHLEETLPPGTRNVPWYLCLSCWIEGAPPKGAAARVIEPAAPQVVIQPPPPPEPAPPTAKPAKAPRRANAKRTTVAP